MEELKTKIDEEEAQSKYSSMIPPSKSDEIKNIDSPNDDDQEQKISVFKAYMFSEAQKITTPDLLGKIVEIINNTYLDEVKLKNEQENEDVADKNENIDPMLIEDSLDETKVTLNDKINEQIPPKKNV